MLKSIAAAYTVVSAVYIVVSIVGYWCEGPMQSVQSAGRGSQQRVQLEQAFPAAASPLHLHASALTFERPCCAVLLLLQGVW